MRWQRSRNKQKCPEYIFGDRDLSPLPEERNHTYTRDPPLSTEQKREFRRENKKRLDDAITYRVTLPPGYDLVAEQARSAGKNGRPTPEEPSRRGGITIDVDDSVNRFICDSTGYVAALVMPEYLGGTMLSSATYKSTVLGQSSCATFMRRECDNIRAKEKNTTKKALRSLRTQAVNFIKRKLAKMGKLDRSPESEQLLQNLKKARDPGPSADWAGTWIETCDGDRYQPINTFGTLHLVKAWQAIGHQFADSSLPSTDTMAQATINELCIRFQFMDGMAGVDYRINDLVEKAYPQFSELIREVHSNVEKNPLIYALKHIWHSDFLGRAVLFNKQSAQHLDVSGVHRGWDILVAMGDFEGGALYLKDMNVRIPFRPGTLIAFDGTAQRHEIGSFTGPQRISHVYFVHSSVFSEFDIPTNHLPDLHINDVAKQLFTPAHGRWNLVPKKRGWS
ncbi:2OGFeDO family oxygenase domain protein [Rhizoctonia solani AG-3 Rhs1AP]|uniref:2OGFeDO family oxygenase domain protein n=2 Tax=Rhizoctonia solani AG-3 TaxID=1086053 RepID=A0A074S596_9AGAM|nr:2OGFeDO family oxygenase domain protein [Rhizoctonia solani AG-3 Rhs1AP]KEP45232.1 2OGFeDO family oxygenase domain protein [Rhizoctonia solani 123E]